MDDSRERLNALQHASADFIRNRQHLTSFIYGLVRESQTVEDIFQEVWMRLARAIEEGTEIQHQSKWCRGVAKNLVLLHWRKHYRANVVIDSRIVDLIDCAFAEHETDGLWSERRSALDECLKHLPERSRMLLTLKYEEELSISEIAERMEQSMDAVAKALVRLRRALETCVTKRIRLSTC